MKTFEPFEFDYKSGLWQLEEFEQLLSSKSELSESRDILPFFKTKKHLSALVGTLNPNIVQFDMLAFELDLWGDFACDMAVGDSRIGSYCLIEFEDAKSDSIFKKNGKKNTLEWSPRFEHGFSQVVDWLWALDDNKQTSKYRKLFKSDEINFTAYLIIGRKKFIDNEQRFRWRQNKVRVNSHQVHCFTFDDLLLALQRKTTFFELLVNEKTG